MEIKTINSKQIKQCLIVLKQIDPESLSKDDIGHLWELLLVLLESG
tara:strand:+ start:1194 stop:1331 length:138 start_codon:yes stop_codon:yes gene_type:complete